MAVCYNGVVVVIPTRNRAELAINAIRSVLTQPGCDVQVLVSDNSTNEDDAGALLRFCDKLNDERLRYIRAPESMSMPMHWEWAMQQALHLYAVNHVMYLTDRMVFKTAALRQVLHLVKLHPESILSYNHDKVDDTETPCRLEQVVWTGKLLNIKAEQLLYLSSRMTFHGCMPRMLNCVVPRYILEKIRSRFGSIFLSIAPDFCFAYRSLEVVNSILYFDKSPILHYALDRSNGVSQITGVVSRDHEDFLANLGHAPLNFAAPVPELRTVGNAVVHEYCVVKEEACSEKFCDVDRALYLQAIDYEVNQLQNPQLKRDMLAVLETEGWNAADCGRATNGWLGLGEMLAPLLKSVRLRVLFERIVSVHWPDTRLWYPLDTLLQLVLYRCFNWFPAHTYVRCDASVLAIDHANNFPQRRFRSARHLKVLVEGGGSIEEGEAL